MSSPQWVLKRCLLPEMTSLTKQDNLAYPGAGKRKTDPGSWIKLDEMAGAWWEAGATQKPALDFPGFSAVLSSYIMQLTLSNPESRATEGPRVTGG